MSAPRALEPGLWPTEETAAPQAGRSFHQLQFTGTGKEYFRIWIVNLLLTVLTLGIYSAWAKVRRLQYFDRNTQLDGAVFAFDGKPAAILRGRVLAVLLLGLYQYAFGFSVQFGAVVVAGLILSLPLMMRGALRFRLSSTRYRGLRLHFTGGAGAAYVAYMPMFAMILLPAALAALDRRAVAIVPLLYLAWPLMSRTMKRYQHGNVSYASLDSCCDLPKGSFYPAYFVIGLWGLGGAVLAGGTVAVLSGLANKYAASGGAALDTAAAIVPMAVALLMLYLVYLVALPYLRVTLGNRTLNATSFPGVSLVSEMEAIPFIKLQTANALLTLVTLGLYRPFAVVKVYRYRLAHLTLIVDADVEARLQAADAGQSNARSDGAGDFLGVDLSW